VIQMTVRGAQVAMTDLLLDEVHPCGLPSMVRRRESRADAEALLVTTEHQDIQRRLMQPVSISDSHGWDEMADRCRSLTLPHREYSAPTWLHIAGLVWNLVGSVLG
jgi:hypothetical protein